MKNINFEKELEELKSTLMKINNDTRKKKRLTLQMED